MLGLGRQRLPFKIVPIHCCERFSQSFVCNYLFINYRSMGDVIVFDNTMRKFIVLDDNNDELSPSS